MPFCVENQKNQLKCHDNNIIIYVYNGEFYMWHIGEAFNE